MPQRESMRLRRDDTGSGLRPPGTTGTEPFNSALRSDFFHIPIELREGQTTLAVQDVGYDKLRISYDPDGVPSDPTFGTYLEAVIIRSPAGLPQTNLDGVEISRVVPGALELNEGWVAVIDKQLSPGHWYYYGLFARYFHAGNTHWLRVGEAAALLPYPFGYPERFWRSVPEWYRRQDSEGVGSNDTLQRIVKLLGYEFDLHRTYVSTVGDVWNADKMASKLIAQRGMSMDLPYEAVAGDKRYRNLVGNLLFLRKSKGTANGLAAYLTALTGYKCIAYDGPNMLLTANDSGARDNVGNWSAAGATQSVDRVVSAGGGTLPPAGTPYLRVLASGTTTLIARLGSLTNMTVNVPVTAGRSYKFASTIGLSTGTTQTLRYTFRWFDKTGVLISSPVNQDIASGLSTTWTRRNSPATTVPANAAFVAIDVTHTTGTVASGVAIGVWNMILVDTEWRPLGVPGTSTVAPLSTTNPGHYSDTGYYEDPRRAWINLYPQRVNLALNSNFELNNLPAGAWVASDVPTYDLIQRAYSDYADILDGAPADGEVDYNDLLAHINPLSGQWSISFDTANNRLALDTSVTTSPWYMQVSSALFPVHNLSGWSAACEASSTHPATRVRLSIRWYSANSTGSPVLDAEGNEMSSQGDYVTLGGNTLRPLIQNVYPPEGASYGRLLIEAVNDESDHTTYIQRVIIDNTSMAGTYFNGGITDGDYGDFFYANAAHTSYSAYYMNYRSFVSGVGGTDRITSLMTELIPPGRSWKVLAANTGLY